MAEIDPAEVEKFNRLASDWWDPNGRMKPLHRLNPVRLTYLRDTLAAHFGRDIRAAQPFKGLTLLDIKDHSSPKLIKHHNWSPPYGGGTHSPLPLPGRDLLVVADEAVLDNEEDGRKHTWIFDIRVPENPISISTFPIPSEADYSKKGGHFGPHN
eukprot:gene1714-2250_t